MSKKKGRQINTADGALREMEKIITSFHRHGVYQVFSDFLTMAACSISNSLDRRFFEEREKLYLDTVKRYSKDEAERFAQLLGLLVQVFEPVAGEVVYRDALGELYMGLELGNEWTGQFFTPYSVALMKAMMVLGDADALRVEIEARGFVRALEPCVGGGALVIATADAMKRLGINYQQHLHFTCIDVDFKAVCMAYIQLSLLHIPAVIVHGNALSLEQWSGWFTPAHLLGLWDTKLHREWRVTYNHVHEINEVMRPAAAKTVDGIEAEEEPVGQMTLF
jgi:type I restriction-modification system DNA methylase subunit